MDLIQKGVDLMARLNAANNAHSLLVNAITEFDTSLEVLDGSIFPVPPFLITIEDEIIEVGAKSENVFSDLLRGQEGTTAVAHSDGVTIENRMTAGMYDGLVGQEAFASHLAEKASQNALGHIKIGEAGSIDANGVYTPGGFTLIQATRDISLTGNQVITGVGFSPRAVVMQALVGNTTSYAFGFATPAIARSAYQYNGIWGNPGTFLLDLVLGVSLESYVSSYSFNSDGITLTWTKVGSLNIFPII